MRLQFPDVLDDLIDLRVAEHRSERGHRAHLTVLDTVAKKVVVALCIHELRSLARNAPPIVMTPTTGRCEQLADIDWRVILRSGRRLRLSRCGASQRTGQHRSQHTYDAIVQLHSTYSISNEVPSRPVVVVTSP